MRTPTCICYAVCLAVMTLAACRTSPTSADGPDGSAVTLPPGRELAVEYSQMRPAPGAPVPIYQLSSGASGTLVLTGAFTESSAEGPFRARAFLDGASLAIRVERAPCPAGTICATFSLVSQLNFVATVRNLAPGTYTVRFVPSADVLAPRDPILVGTALVP